MDAELKQAFKEAMDHALGKLTEHELLRPGKDIYISYDVGIIGDQIVPVVNVISGGDMGNYFNASDFPEGMREYYHRQIVGTQGQQAIAKDATPHQAALMLRTYWEAISGEDA